MFHGGGSVPSPRVGKGIGGIEASSRKFFMLGRAVQSLHPPQLEIPYSRGHWCSAVGLWAFMKLEIGSGGSLWIPRSQWDQRELSFTLCVGQHCSKWLKMSLKCRKMTKMDVKCEWKRATRTKRVPEGYLEGTPFGQIWFAFGFIGLEKGSK